MNSNSMLREIAKRLDGMVYENLTKAEKQIVDLLIEEGYMDNNSGIAKESLW